MSVRPQEPTDGGVALNLPTIFRLSPAPNLWIPIPDTRPGPETVRTTCAKQVSASLDSFVHSQPAETETRASVISGE